jgi:hypothetical protein
LVAGNSYCGIEIAIASLKLFFLESHRPGCKTFATPAQPTAMLLTMSTTHPRTNDFISLLSHWHVHKAESTFLKRLSMRCLEVVALAAAMLFVPFTMHRVVQGVDEVYELLGRRSQSPYVTVSWTSIAIAVFMLLGWHIWLGRLGYKAIQETASVAMDDTTTTPAERAVPHERMSQEIRVSWGRILGRLVIPCLLVTLGSHFIFQIFIRIKDPRPTMTLNTVDMQEAMGQLYGFR